MAGELAKAAKKVKTLPNQMVRAGTKSIAKPLGQAYLRDSGGDGRLSGLKNSDKFKATTSVRGTYAVKGSVRIGPRSMRGPASWLNYGTNPHGGHPGTRGKRTFDRVVQAELPEAARLMERMFNDSLK